MSEIEYIDENFEGVTTQGVTLLAEKVYKIDSLQCIFKNCYNNYYNSSFYSCTRKSPGPNDCYLMANNRGSDNKTIELGVFNPNTAGANYKANLKYYKDVTPAPVGPLGKWVEIPYRFYGVPESYANWYGALIERERYTSGSIYSSNIIGSDKIYATTMANGHLLIATLYEWYEPENNRIIDLLEIGTPTLVFDPVSGTYDYEGFGGFMPYTYDGVFYDNKYTYNGVTYFAQESYAEYPDITDPYAPQGVYIDEEGIWMPRQEAYTTKEIALDDFYRTHT